MRAGRYQRTAGLVLPLSPRVSLLIGIAAIAVAGSLVACTSAQFTNREPPRATRPLVNGSDAALTPSPQRLLARGTEPFWLLEVEGERLHWKTPEQPEGRWLSVERHDGPGSARYSGHDGARPFVLVITAAPCSDGMSDLVYPFAAVWTYGAVTRRGCALPQD